MLRIKEQEICLTLQEHDHGDDENIAALSSATFCNHPNTLRGITALKNRIFTAMTVGVAVEGFWL